VAEKVARDPWTKALQGQENKIGFIRKDRLHILLSGERRTLDQCEAWRHCKDKEKKNRKKGEERIERLSQDSTAVNLAKDFAVDPMSSHGSALLVAPSGHRRKKRADHHDNQPPWTGTGECSGRCVRS